MEFKKVLAGAYCVLEERRQRFGQALLWPGIALLVLDAAHYLGLNYWWAVGILILKLPLQILFAVTVHRIVLLGEDSVPKWGIVKWTWRETIFGVHLLGLSLLALPTMSTLFVPGVDKALAWFGFLVALLVCLWLVARFSLAFPGIAVGDKASFAWSWQATKHHQGVMLLVVIVLPLLLSIPLYIVDLMPQSYMLTNVLALLMFAFEVAVLSMAYMLITQQDTTNATEAHHEPQ